MDKYELADQYINKIREDFHPHMIQGTGVLSLALIRACDDILKIKNQVETAIAGTTVPTPQNRSGAEHPPIGPDPQGDPNAEQDDHATRAPDGVPWSTHSWPRLRTLTDEPINSEEPASPIHCPNCGELAEMILLKRKNCYIYCEHCEYEETR